MQFPLWVNAHALLLRLGNRGLCYSPDIVRVGSEAERLAFAMVETFPGEFDGVRVQQSAGERQQGVA